MARGLKLATARMVVVVATAAAIPTTVAAADPDPKLEDALAHARTKGDEAVNVIVAQFGRLSGGSRHQAIRALGEAGTEDARTFLLEIAMEKHGDEWVEWAATNYVLSLKNKSDARKLLAAKRWQVQHIGLLGLCGSEVDRELFAELQKMLSSDRFSLRRAAGWVIHDDTADPGIPFREKAKAVISSLETLWDMPGADRVIAVHSSPDGYYSAAGFSGHCLIRALMAKGGGVDVLKELTPSDSGNPRDCVLVARAFLQDRSVRDEIKRIVKGSEIQSLREYALAAFERIVVQEDRGFLSDLAENDPMSFETNWEQREVFERAGLPADRYYPIRFLAKEILYRLDRTVKPDLHE